MDGRSTPQLDAVFFLHFHRNPAITRARFASRGQRAGLRKTIGNRDSVGSNTQIDMGITSSCRGVLNGDE
jgi:hypothetical protein